MTNLTTTITIPADLAEEFAAVAQENHCTETRLFLEIWRVYQRYQDHEDDVEDSLELKDQRVQRIIEESRKESLAGKTRDARLLLAELEAEDEKDRKRTP